MYWLFQLKPVLWIRGPGWIHITLFFQLKPVFWIRGSGWIHKIVFSVETSVVDPRIWLDPHNFVFFQLKPVLWIRGPGWIHIIVFSVETSVVDPRISLDPYNFVFFSWNQCRGSGDLVGSSYFFPIGSIKRPWLFCLMGRKHNNDCTSFF